jgi:hypothetical protein
MQSISDNIKIILEELIQKHAVIEDLPDKKTTLDIIHGTHHINKPTHKGKIKVSEVHLKTMSPRGLYRAKGVNITKYHKIMNDNGVPGHDSKSKSKNSFINT